MLKAVNERLRERVVQLCQQGGVALDETLHGDITSMINEHTMDFIYLSVDT